MRGMSIAAAAAGLAWCLTAATPAEVTVGSTREEVIAELGRPELEFTRNGKQVLMYYGLELDLAGGRVVRIPPHLQAELRRRAEQREKDQAMIQRGMVQTSAGWAKASSRPHQAVVPLVGGRGGAPHGVKVLSNGGARVDMKDLLQPGKVTMVDFYADWCGPCRQLAPHLEQMAAADAAVHLVKIDIVHWQTPVARQYKLRSIPNVRVYDGRGRQVGKPTSRLSDIRKYVDRAK